MFMEYALTSTILPTVSSPLTDGYDLAIGKRLDLEV